MERIQFDFVRRPAEIHSRLFCLSENSPCLLIHRKPSHLLLFSSLFNAIDDLSSLVHGGQPELGEMESQDGITVRPMRRMVPTLD